MKIPGPMNKTDAPFRISNSCCGGRFFVGALDEMRISNIPRTEAEIKDVMERGLANHKPKALVNEVNILAVELSERLPTIWGRIKSNSSEAFDF